MSRIFAALRDVVLLVFAVPSGFVLWGVRRIGLHRLPLTRSALVRIGVLPIRRHYYDPFVTAEDLRYPLDQERPLPGIDWNLPEQLALLQSMIFAAETADFGAHDRPALTYRTGNDSFESGDAEYLYQIIRLKKPRRIFEVGSGHSTLVARQAIRKNLEESPGLTCKHLCIEPYEMPWLESSGVTVIRQRLETIDRALFSELQADDLLFIDSSHIIRPQGDVLTEYLEIIPTLRPGVIVHIHDIFTPRDYPDAWVRGRMLLWNEQYLLEAFLSGNRDWKVIGALNLLRHRYYDEMQRVCPHLTPDSEPGSFYIQRIR